jgi:hypothetical protein
MKYKIYFVLDFQKIWHLLIILRTKFRYANNPWIEIGIYALL